MNDEDLATLGCFGRVLFNLWGIGAVYALVACIAESDLGRFRDPIYGMPAMLAPVYIGYILVCFSRWCRPRIKAGVATAKSNVANAKVKMNTAIGYASEKVRCFILENIPLIVAATIVAMAIVVAAFIAREPRYKPMGNGNVILDTHTGKTSYWYDAPEIFPKADNFSK